MIGLLLCLIAPREDKLIEIKDSEAIQYVGKIVLCPCGRLLFIVQETCGPHDEAPPFRP
jgi:hypothetical protein